MGAKPSDPSMAIRAQDQYMLYLENMFDGSWEKALAGYNCGEGRVQRAQRRVMARGLTDTPERRLWLRELPEETRNYVQVIPGKHLAWVMERTK